MKKFWLSLFALLLATAVPVSAEAAAGVVRIGTVNLEKVFRGFYKSKIAEDAIKRQGEIYREYLARQNENLKTLEKEYDTLLANSQNLALDGEARQQARRDTDAKRREIESQRAAIELYATDRARDMRRMEDEKRVAVMNEILAEVRRRAAAEGYDFIFDSSGQTLNQQPALLVSPASADITATVLADLNRTAASPKPETNPKKDK
ncbi:MAG: OmpH family outer membrane protein [Victivallaceae bacterium]|nr:OmpH family outer membrane protein [Victivallaceae bacterium]